MRYDLGYLTMRPVGSNRLRIRSASVTYVLGMTVTHVTGIDSLRPRAAAQPEEAGIRATTLQRHLMHVRSNSCGCLMVELQQSPETLAAPDRTGRADLFSRKEEEIAFALMISLGVEMLNIGAQRGP